ncbi:MAG: glutathione S-transferase N-terminal domain-containing protein [Deltaproteobacteria bacterium]|nr:glutathione S-transferase N-terminal domain-containing protein [Deltaproteobacteria bacterium]
MQRQQRVAQISTLLEQTGHAHHEAFAATDGADPDWAIWYAEYLSTRLPEALGTTLTRTQIICLLTELEQEAAARSEEGTPWPLFYSRELVARFVADTEETLSLYVMNGCPFCMRVQATIDRLGIEIPQIDIYEDPDARAELIAARGRGTVPVLRCISGDIDRWMPESRDIIRYLEERFGG